jgi:hypothetical protein
MLKLADEYERRARENDEDEAEAIGMAYAMEFQEKAVAFYTWCRVNAVLARHLSTGSNGSAMLCEEEGMATNHLASRARATVTIATFSWIREHRSAHSGRRYAQKRSR